MLYPIYAWYGPGVRRLGDGRGAGGGGEERDAPGTTLVMACVEVGAAAPEEACGWLDPEEGEGELVGALVGDERAPVVWL